MAKRILVVDDDRTMVETLCDILELRGWETYRAYDGLAATRVAENERVDVVLMDVKMPQMNGVEALKRMKATRPAIRVVLMTAYAAAELLAQAEREGALTIARKPIDVGEILVLLEEAVDRAQSVLIVDDDPQYLATMADLLEHHGVKVSKAQTLKDALGLMERVAPGAVLLDLKLSGVNSTDHLVAFKEISPSTLLVLHSGFAEELHHAVDRAPRGMIAGAFTKPLSIDRLLEFLDGSAKA